MTEATKSQRPEIAESTLTPEQVSDYLAGHPEFFEEHRGVLNSLSIPHTNSGQSTSLIERQVASLRNDNARLTQRLNSLIENARTNDQLFEKTKSLLLTLVAANTVIQVRDRIEAAMPEDFGSACCRLRLINDSAGLPDELLLSEQELRSKAERLLTSNQPFCGLLKEEECSLLFADQAELVGSAAVMPLRAGGRLVGVLAIANQDRDYYRDNMDTSLLTFIGDVTATIIDRLTGC